MAKLNGARTLPKTILVAGGAGFLGSHLCELLINAGHRVHCLDNLQTGAASNIEPLTREPRFEFIEADIGRPLRWTFPVDEVYNLACPASPPHYQADPIRTMMTSVGGTHHLLEVARQHRAVYLQASTSEVYGDPQEHPQREDYWGHVNPTGPRACYDEGKRAAEALCFDYLRHHRTDARVARIFNTYGPRMQPDDGRIISNFVTQALRSEPLTIHGDGQQTRSFCYVSDLVAGLQALMEHGDNPRRPLNLGNSGEFTVLDLASLVLSLTGSTSEIIHKPLPEDDPQRRRPDISKALSVLGWAPQVPLREGLPLTIDWFKERLGTCRMGGSPIGQPAARDDRHLAARAPL